MDRSLGRQSFQSILAYHLLHVFHFRLISFPLQSLHGDNIVDLEVENNKRLQQIPDLILQNLPVQKDEIMKEIQKERKIYSNRNDE